MELLKALLGRRSIRKYRKKKVEREKIEEILKAGTWAPSSGNTQSWRFFVVKDKKRREITRACFNQSQVMNASHLIVVGYDEDVVRRSYGRRGLKLYGIQDSALAAGHIMLRAYELGLGTCWIGKFDEKKVKELVGVPDNVRPVAVLTVGYSDESPKSSRRDWEEVTLFVEE